MTGGEGSVSCGILISACLIGIPCRYDGRAALSVPAAQVTITLIANIIFWAALVMTVYSGCEYV